MGQGRGDRVRLIAGQPAAESHEACAEQVLELGHQRSLDADEEVVEPAVDEVVFDPGAADIADLPVDDEDLAVVEMGQVPDANSPPSATDRANELDRATWRC